MSVVVVALYHHIVDHSQSAEPTHAHMPNEPLLAFSISWEVAPLEGEEVHR